MKLANLNRVQWLICIAILCFSGRLIAEDGYRLWLRYDKVTEPALLSSYRNHAKEIVIQETDQTSNAVREELKNGLHGLLDKVIPVKNHVSKGGAIIVGTYKKSSVIKQILPPSELESTGEEGYIIRSLSFKNSPVTVIAANSPKGVLYGAFHFLRLLQTRKSIDNLSIKSRPRIMKRLLNHWDNLNGTVERGYAGSLRRHLRE